MILAVKLEQFQSSKLVDTSLQWGIYTESLLKTSIQNPANQGLFPRSLSTPQFLSFDIRVLRWSCCTFIITQLPATLKSLLDFDCSVCVVFAQRVYSHQGRRGKIKGASGLINAWHLGLALSFSQRGCCAIKLWDARCAHTMVRAGEKKSQGKRKEKFHLVAFSYGFWEMRHITEPVHFSRRHFLSRPRVVEN